MNAKQGPYQLNYIPSHLCMYIFVTTCVCVYTCTHMHVEVRQLAGPDSLLHHVSGPKETPFPQILAVRQSQHSSGTCEASVPLPKGAWQKGQMVFVMPD